LYSGGKDSTYMLDRFVNEYGKRVLSYTFDVPFESKHVAENIERVRSRINADFFIDRDDEPIKKMMRHVFNGLTPRKPGKYLDEKLPCVSCRSFFLIRAILLAHKKKIPYIIFCADPQQMLTVESDVRRVVKNFYATFGRDLAGELFDREIEEILFADDEELPKIVFPFIALRNDYDPDRMIAELKAKGLYDSSPMETHCTLFPLLNYYSFKHWNAMFYKLNASSYIRAKMLNEHNDRATFSVKFPRTIDIIGIEERLKRIVFGLADGDDPGAHEEELMTIFGELGASEEASRFVSRNFVAMRETAAQLGINLDMEKL
jgi:hypothetical protein